MAPVTDRLDVPGSLAASLKDKSSDAFWAALRVLREREMLLREQTFAGDKKTEADAEIAVIEQVAQGLRHLVDKSPQNGDRSERQT